MADQNYRLGNQTVLIYSEYSHHTRNYSYINTFNCFTQYSPLRNYDRTT